MAFVVARADGRFEIRESAHTPRGPRARTLATFRALTPEVLERARSRAHGPFDDRALLARSRELGAPQGPPSDAPLLARRLAARVRAGHPIPPALAAVIAGGAPRGPRAVPDSLEGALDWLGASPHERGRALRDLVRLASRLPARDRGPLAYPPLTPARRDAA